MCRYNTPQGLKKKPKKFVAMVLHLVPVPIQKYRHHIWHRYQLKSTGTTWYRCQFKSIGTIFGIGTNSKVPVPYLVPVPQTFKVSYSRPRLSITADSTSSFSRFPGVPRQPGWLGYVRVQGQVAFPESTDSSLAMIASSKTFLSPF